MFYIQYDWATIKNYTKPFRRKLFTKDNRPPHVEHD